MTIEPGIYKSLPDDEYRAIDAESCSGLLSRFFRQVRREPTLADLERFDIGTAIHRYWQGLGLGVEFCDDHDLRTPEGKDAFAHAREVEHGLVLVIRRRHREMIQSVTSGLKDDPLPKFQAYCADHPERVEVTLVGELHGVLVKGRIDLVGDAALWDIKTTSCGSQHEFERLSLWKYFYPMQAALYLDLFNQLAPGSKAAAFNFLCISKRPVEWPVWVTEMQPAHFEWGRQMYQAIINSRKDDSDGKPQDQDEVLEDQAGDGSDPEERGEPAHEVTASQAR